MKSVPLRLSGNFSPYRLFDAISTPMPSAITANCLRVARYCGSSQAILAPCALRKAYLRCFLTAIVASISANALGRDQTRTSTPSMLRTSLTGGLPASKSGDGALIAPTLPVTNASHGLRKKFQLDTNSVTKTLRIYQPALSQGDMAFKPLLRLSISAFL